MLFLPGETIPLLVALSLISGSIILAQQKSEVPATPQGQRRLFEVYASGTFCDWSGRVRV